MAKLGARAGRFTKLVKLPGARRASAGARRASAGGLKVLLLEEKGHKSKDHV